MAAAGVGLIPSASTLTTSIAPKPVITHRYNHRNLPQSLLRFKFSRRDVSLLSFLSLMPSIYVPPPSTAFTIGISGPKDWLREQKKKAAKFLLAPIDASRESLRTAYLLLTGTDSDLSDKEMEEFRRLMRSAARDCVTGDRNSFVKFQANTGVEVCTFRLIVKNASSLLDDRNPVKLEAEAILSDLISSFTSLNVVANETDIRQASCRQIVSDALTDAISSLNKFEQGIKDCLEI